MKGKQVRLFLVEGSTGSLMTAEIMNWTGHLIAAPRTELPQLLARPEAKGTGVYILLGDDPDGTYETKVYLGEGDSVDTRLRVHAKPQDSGGKDFWNRVVVISSKDANITKAHARYLESRLIAITTETKRATLDNGTSPPGQPLPEADRSDMEYFIAQLKIVLPVLGVHILRATRQQPRPQSSSVAPSTSTAADAEEATEARQGNASPEFRLRVARNPDRFARAVELDSEFVIKAGSFASAQVKVMHPGYKNKRDTLVRTGVLLPVPESSEVLQLAQDVVFSSVSEAASVMNGSSENGRKRWVTEDGISYGTWQGQGA
ncbi:GIY-YIG nuclease family protein [Mumia sp. DW29H23]|uniref:GIY-YIG nuclease family protein n=1 Tax=Mumia sp. DW29H23 TaxID=3421241 RepID=UPI003D6958D3